MPGFSLSPLGTFPPPTNDDFPVGIQWQDDGVDLGDRAVDTVNLRDGIVGSRGTGETANVLTIDVASSPSGAAAAEPWLGRFFGSLAFDGVSYSGWTNVFENAASADFSLSGTTLTILRSGIYSVTMQVAMQPDVSGLQLWPTGAAAFGIGLTDAFNEIYSSPTRFSQVGDIHGLASDNQRQQFTATFSLIVAGVDVPKQVLPYAFVDCPTSSAGTASVSVTMTALRIGAAP